MFAQKCNKSNARYLEGDEIKHYYNLLTQREEIDVIFNNYAKSDGQMSLNDLMTFLVNEQREQATAEGALKLIEKYEVDETGKSFLHNFMFSGYDVSVVSRYSSYAFFLWSS